MRVRLAIRGFAEGVQVFEDLLDLDEEALDNLLPELAEKHGHAMAAHELHIIEIEFLDEPDPLQRFFRIGTDPRHMVMPIRVDLSAPRPN